MSRHSFVFFYFDVVLDSDNGLGSYKEFLKFLKVDSLTFVGVEGRENAHGEFAFEGDADPEADSVDLVEGELAVLLLVVLEEQVADPGLQTHRAGDLLHAAFL